MDEKSKQKQASASREVRRLTQVNLVKLRNRLEFTQQEMADSLRISVETYGMCERGQRELKLSSYWLIWKKFHLNILEEDSEQFERSLNGLELETVPNIHAVLCASWRDCKISMNRYKGHLENYFYCSFSKMRRTIIKGRDQVYLTSVCYNVVNFVMAKFGIPFGLYNSTVDWIHLASFIIMAVLMPFELQNIWKLYQSKKRLNS